jgi:hypothetical protein
MHVVECVFTAAGTSKFVVHPVMLVNVAPPTSPAFLIISILLLVCAEWQAGGGDAGSTRPSTGREWESFGTSPGEDVPDAAAAPTANPFAAGSVASSVPYEESQQPQEVPQQSPFSELNPLRRGQHAAAGEGDASTGLAVGYPVPSMPAGYPSPASSLAQETPLRPTPAASMPSLAAPFSTPPPQHINRFAGALDPAALAAAMQQLSVQQALAAQLGPGAGMHAQQQGLCLNPADPEAAAAVARAQVQLEAAAAQLVAAATARPHYSPSNSGSEVHSGCASRGGSVDGLRQATFTARDHNSPRLGRHLSSAEQRPPSRPSRLSQQSPSTSTGTAPDGAPMTARAAAQSQVVQLSSWQPMPAEDLDRCKKMFVAKVGGLYGCVCVCLEGGWGADY